MALYARLRPEGEPELIHSLAPPGAAVLELGCAAGRITHALAALGHPVVAVDQSPEMLACVRARRGGVEAVLSDIESLDLDRSFPVVVLASHLVNTPDDDRRNRFLRACRGHAEPAGVVLVERLDPWWAASAVEACSERDGIRFSLHDIRRRGAFISLVMEYRCEGHTWRHPFRARVLDDEDMAAALGGAGLTLSRWADSRRTWAVAQPA